MLCLQPMKQVGEWATLSHVACSVQVTLVNQHSAFDLSDFLTCHEHSLLSITRGIVSPTACIQPTASLVMT